MSDLQLWDGLIGAMIGAAVGAVPAVLALRSSGKANKLTAAANETAKTATEEAGQATSEMVKANEISSAALEEARQANEVAAAANAIAESALEEARAARKIQYDDWHRQATPNVVLELGREQHELGGHALKFSCDRDIDSGELSLAAGYDAKAITGLGASPDEQVFNFGRSVTLGAVEAGTTAVKGIWTGDPARANGLTVQIRCTVTIDGVSWTVAKPVTFPRLAVGAVALVPRADGEPDISTAGF
jgi:gas vesicle protein